MSEADFRLEKDSLGEVSIPVDALYGPQTQRAINNFPVSGIPMPRPFIRALGLLKYACAVTNHDIGELESSTAKAIQQAAKEVSLGHYDSHFPVDIFQSGSGTSTNMNANEVIASLASQSLDIPVHPNDHVNKSQSSNDVIPTCIHLAAALLLNEQLLPALDHLATILEHKMSAHPTAVKTGRTHLMDAMPITFTQEISGWLAQITQAKERLISVQPRLHQLAIGGTAVGTGINAPKGFAMRVCSELSNITAINFEVTDNHFAALSSQDTAVELSGQLKVLAVALIKMSNDLRWSNSGPIAGLGELSLQELQPGSSIMPGKVNPVIPEAVIMASTQIIGNDSCITLAGQSGSFQLNVMLPLVAHNLIQSLQLLSNSTYLLADKAIQNMQINEKHAAAKLAHNPILVTALNPVVGYDLGVVIAKKAYAENRSVLDVALELTDIEEAVLRKLLDPKNLV